MLNKIALRNNNKSEKNPYSDFVNSAVDKYTDYIGNTMKRTSEKNIKIEPSEPFKKRNKNVIILDQLVEKNKKEFEKMEQNSSLDPNLSE